MMFVDTARSNINTIKILLNGWVTTNRSRCMNAKKVQSDMQNEARPGIVSQAPRSTTAPAA
jgi:hypothetical protein